MPACREEMARHARLADELRLPSFQWYTPLWAAVDALLAGRFDEADELAARGRGAGGVRAGDRNAELFADMLLFTGQLERGEFDQVDLAFIEDKIANSPAGPAYAASYAWVLAGRGETDRARATLDARSRTRTRFDANWMSAQAECAEACVVLGDATHAAVVYERLAPYAGRPLTAGRAVTSYGASTATSAAWPRCSAAATTPRATRRDRAQPRARLHRVGRARAGRSRRSPCAHARRRDRAVAQRPRRTLQRRWRSSWRRCSSSRPRSPGSSTRCASTPCAARRARCRPSGSGRSTAAWR